MHTHTHTHTHIVNTHTNAPIHMARPAQFLHRQTDRQTDTDTHLIEASVLLDDRHVVFPAASQLFHELHLSQQQKYQSPQSVQTNL